VKHFFRAFLLLSLLGLFAAGVYPHEAIQTPAQDQSVQVIDMTAKKYKFSPTPVHVKRGMKIQLRITAIDHVHGFKINIYPDGADAKGAPGLVFTTPKDCWRLEKGQVTTIEFVAQTAGSYPFKCCVFCGFGHMGMKGELIVDP
jgi:cytochrome c oxidase subunit 2